ncbi:GGDEF domain-containing protein [Roseateles sp. BYS180W]|uniref:diguanylate cyclase n=1 Tax=Roseateles rivi TaxID=3299028 RepID=A0ABW7FSI1_9BURK
MSEVVEHLAVLTGFRDRDVMDATLVSSLADMLAPQSVAAYRVLGEHSDQRWVTRACMNAGQTIVSAQELRLEELPPVADFPHRQMCLESGQENFLQQDDRHIALFPLASEQQVVGVLEITSAEPLGEQARRTVAAVLRIYRNFMGLLDYSERDTLTGLLNRKTFDTVFLKQLQQRQPLMQDETVGRRHTVGEVRGYLGVVDIDHFKSINDRFGHLIGDEVLLLLARLMSSTFRYHDQVYRFGGEEFVVLMRCKSAQDAEQAFERFRAATQAFPFPQVGELTVSVGYTEIRDMDSPTQALQRADAAVYYAKEHGRNQVCNHAQLLVLGHLKDEDSPSSVELF